MDDHIDSGKDAKNNDHQDNGVSEPCGNDISSQETSGPDSLTQETFHNLQGTFPNLYKVENDTEAIESVADEKFSVEPGPEISHFLKTADHSNISEQRDVLDSASVVHGVGHMLRNARMARNMSVEEVSRQLRISGDQIEAIEKERFDALPGRTFVRGFVRNYANLMQLDAHSIVRMLPGPTTTVPPIEHTPFKVQEMKPSSRDGKNGINSVVLIIVVLVFLAIVAFFLYQRIPFGQSVEDQEQKIDSTIQQDGRASVELQLPLSSIKSPDKQEELVQFSQNSLTRLGSVSKMNAFGTINLSFNADAHVKISDGNSDIIFEQNNTRGTQQRISGKRPLSIVISDASAVEVTYNDRVIDIMPYTHEQNGSAQLTLE